LVEVETDRSAVVIEAGLDYGRDHLRDGLDKLANSGVRAPYVLHLSRVTDPLWRETENLMVRSGVTCAYVSVDPDSGDRRWKNLHDADICQGPRGPAHGRP
jgi:hypothetical protein